MTSLQEHALSQGEQQQQQQNSAPFSHCVNSILCPCLVSISFVIIQADIFNIYIEYAGKPPTLVLNG